MKNLLGALFGLILTAVIFGFVASGAAQVTNPILKDAQNAAANAPDLTIANVTRIKGKNELKITIANKGKQSAEKAKISVYALPHRFFPVMDYKPNSLGPYLQKAEQTVAGKTPVELLSGVPSGHEIENYLDGNSPRLMLAWAKFKFEMDFGANASREFLVPFPEQYKPPPGASSKLVYPVPFVKDSAVFHIYAPVSIATFDLSIFQVFVEHPQEVKKDNNTFFFNQRERK